jgi:hypothetical protein
MYESRSFDIFKRLHKEAEFEAREHYWKLMSEGKLEESENFEKYKAEIISRKRSELPIEQNKQLSNGFISWLERDKKIKKYV